MSDTASPHPTTFTTGSIPVSAATYHKPPRRRPETGLLLVVADVMSAVLAMAVASLVRSWLDPTAAALWSSFPPRDFGTCCILIVCLVLVNDCMTLYETEAGAPFERCRRRVLAALLVPGPVLTFVALSGPITFPIVALLVIATALAVPLGLIGEAFLRRVSPEGWNVNTVLVGDGATVAQLASHFAVRPELGLRPVGFVSDNPAGAPASLSWLGHLAELNELLDGIDVIVIALSPNLSALSPTRLPVRRVVIIPDTANVASARLRNRRFADLAGFEFFNPTQNRRSLRIKRALELCIAVPVALLTLPVIGIAALAIKIISPGPALYVQKRIGWKGTPVTIHKLRSMYLDADLCLQEVLSADPEKRREWERCMKLSHDPRILPYVGSFIRKMSIDELPQLWAVIRGDISLVGPRPLPTYHLEKFGLQFQKLRASVKPGLTGLWQVSERSNADLREQEQIDTFYISNWSLWLDAYIVMRTVPAILAGRGAR